MAAGIEKAVGAQNKNEPRTYQPLYLHVRRDADIHVGVHRSPALPVDGRGSYRVAHQVFYESDAPALPQSGQRTSELACLDGQARGEPLAIGIRCRKGQRYKTLPPSRGSGDRVYHVLTGNIGEYTHQHRFHNL